MKNLYALANILLLALGVMLLFMPSGQTCQVNLNRNGSFEWSDTVNFREGDVILRNGKGVISRILRSMSLVDPTFSHAGILLRQGNGWKVLHMLGGEGAAADGLFLEPVTDFCSLRESDTAAVFRLCNTEEIRRSVVSRCWSMVSMHPKFDSMFDLATDHELYCTEFICKVFSQATAGAISLPLTRYGSVNYAACDNIYLNPYATLVSPRKVNGRIVVQSLD